MARSRNRRQLFKSENLVRLWLLRLLVPLGLHRKFFDRTGVGNDGLASALDLDAWLDLDPDEYDPATLLIELRSLHAQAERTACSTRPPKVLSANVERLANLVGLGDTDQRILEFAILIHSDPVLENSADGLGLLTSARVARCLAVLLNLPERDVRAALSNHCALARTGLVHLDRRASTPLKCKIDLITEDFADAMISSPVEGLDELLRGMVTRTAPPNLSLEDFDHMKESLSIVMPYLGGAREAQRTGVNVFLYGAPGTGKTQLAGAIAKALGCELFEVGVHNADGNPIDGENRLRAFRFAQSFLAGQGKLLLFDEVEDVFNDGDTLFGRKSTAQTRKAWINRTLEQNQVPALWLSNSVDCLDPAFARRFDIIIELPVPPRRQREKILRQACGDLLTPEAAARISAVDELAPAVVTRAARVVQAIRPDLPAAGQTRAIEHLISATLVAQGHAPLKKADACSLPAHYDPAFVNADADLAAVAEGVRGSRNARMCLYGPPGTGKTAYARWLADRLGAPLHARRASDILSKWVGGTERNLARAFCEAEHSGAVLLLDEVDSFLQNRSNAQRSWEISEVNEMLTQMEGFAGIFIASTNVMTGLDPAALRRFDLKLAFGYMEPAQAWALFRRECEALGLGDPDPGLESRLAHLACATPGDFAALRRRHRFSPLASPAAVAAALEAECLLKNVGGRSIGFN